MNTNNDTPSPATTTKSRSRCSWSVAERVEWLRLLDESGQTLSAFCRANDLPESSVSLWRRQQREVIDDSAVDSEFVEVALPPGDASEPTPASSAVLIRLPGERQVEVAAGTDVAWLAALLRAL